MHHPLPSRSQFIIGDGQVTLGSQIIKPNAKKVRPLERGDGVVAGFAGATADAMTLFERLESKLDEHQETMRACVEMAKSWRMDKYLRRLEAVMIVVDKSGVMVTLTGTGDVISPAPCRPDDPECTDSIIGIGSGGHFATAAARALIDVEGLDAESIGRKSMAVAADMCVYTNHNFVSELLVNVPAETPEEAQQRAEAAAAAAPPKEGEAPADAGSKE